jgi:cystathionine beta-lyase/cystathionine gamma-synthase
MRCFAPQVRLMHNVLGGTIDPHAAFLVTRGLKTLALRVRHVNDSALELAKRLEAHPKIARVHYPGGFTLQGRYACNAVYSVLFHVIWHRA